MKNHASMTQCTRFNYYFIIILMYNWGVGRYVKVIGNQGVWDRTFFTNKMKVVSLPETIMRYC